MAPSVGQSCEITLDRLLEHVQNVIAIERVNPSKRGGDLKQKLLNREVFWILKLSTRVPLEIIEDPWDLGDSPQRQHLVNPLEDFVSPNNKEDEESEDQFWDLLVKETAKPNRSTSANKEPLNITKSTSHRKSGNHHVTKEGGGNTTSLKGNRFNAEPKWSMEEDYILVSSPHLTSCPISIKIKARNLPWLKERFVDDIILFLDGRRFSDQEWKRLGHFIPPFGWMELEYSEVLETVSALPHVANQQLLLAEKSGETPNCVTCAVVGNGGILNGSRMGKEIDSHDYVFRVNGAVIQGYEDDVGKRTSFYGFTAFTMLASLYMLNRRGFSTIPRDNETKYILFTEGKRDYEWLKALQQNKELHQGILKQYRLRPRDDFGKDFNFTKLLVVHPDFARYVKNRFLRSDTLNGKYWREYRPSTGALVLLTALHLCDTVSAYGFLTHDYAKYANHYYDKKKTKVTFYMNHDYELEKKLWAQMHEENVIRLYKGTKGL
ncbi:alpha-N-acetylgalactosaminide alpha-2,6-sialyltransferase 1 [Hyla sarda]|uniref:alpha-N-acetylgalactosaminide alpha-2,6-sialyltransferase 1 n=1 Tax=Hyla sarda TaxID=327740 RepID=UPI0024C40B4B|nr:alpha-N-acetylgalactosaminide alpha-2,6-sialyltransferase 1 [Hyla sarda]